MSTKNNKVILPRTEYVKHALLANILALVIFLFVTLLYLVKQGEPILETIGVLGLIVALAYPIWTIGNIIITLLSVLSSIQVRNMQLKRIFFVAISNIIVSVLFSFLNFILLIAFWEMVPSS